MSLPRETFAELPRETLTYRTNGLIFSLQLNNDSDERNESQDKRPDVTIKQTTETHVTQDKCKKRTVFEWT